MTVVIECRWIQVGGSESELYYHRIVVIARREHFSVDRVEPTPYIRSRSTLWLDVNPTMRPR